jgi:hypothetical protein
VRFNLTTEIFNPDDVQSEEPTSRIAPQMQPQFRTPLHINTDDQAQSKESSSERSRTFTTRSQKLIEDMKEVNRALSLLPERVNKNPFSINVSDYVTDHDPHDVDLQYKPVDNPVTTTEGSATFVNTTQVRPDEPDIPYILSEELRNISEGIRAPEQSFHQRQQLQQPQPPQPPQRPPRRRPEYVSKMPMGKGHEMHSSGMTNRQVWENFYKDNLGGDDEEVIKDGTLRDIRKLSLPLAREIYIRDGGDDKEVIKSSYPDEIHDEILLLRDRLTDAKRRYRERGGNNPNILNSTNLNQIEEEINGLNVLGMFF